MWALPQKTLGVNGVKSCNFRQEKYENILSLKHGMERWILVIISIREISRKDDCSIVNIELGSMHTCNMVCNTGEQSEPENMAKTTVGPLSYRSSLYTRPQL